MVQKTRNQLEQIFTNGETLFKGNFTDIIDSFLNLEDEQLWTDEDNGKVGVGINDSPNATLAVRGNVSVGAANNTAPVDGLYIQNVAEIAGTLEVSSGTPQALIIDGTGLACSDPAQDLEFHIIDDKQLHVRGDLEVLGNTTCDNIITPEVLAQDGNGLKFYNQAQAAGVFIDANGNVGIGADVPTPEASLHVQGNVNILTDLTYGGSLTVGGNVSSLGSFSVGSSGASKIKSILSDEVTIDSNNLTFDSHDDPGFQQTVTFDTQFSSDPIVVLSIYTTLNPEFEVDTTAIWASTYNVSSTGFTMNVNGRKYESLGFIPPDINVTWLAIELE